MMKKIDILISAGIGAITAVYFMSLFGQPGFVEKLGGLGSLLWLLIPLFTFLAPICLWIAFLIGKKYLFIFQLAKFILIGVMATIFDLGTLSAFIAYFGISSGIGYLAFKAISFIIATVLKYIPDKFWAFKKHETSGLGKEFYQFFAITLIGLIINVSIANLIVNIVGPQFGLPAALWGNLGGIGAVIITFAWNFIGYKFFVFKK
ncbi:MAG: GtrA family protein [Candidatus Nealsonbacteria bacterium]|nr:GtrA family protein [Candidatus Nealsonbacteria bacterium]